MNYIKNINWIFTYKCNLKCTHCDIWANNYKKELSLDEIEKIVSSDIIQKSYIHYSDIFDIAISWWEPLLIENLNEIMITIDKFLPGAIHSISTNWILTNKLIELLTFWNKKWKSFKKINISIDWDEKEHDLQRWIKWSFKKSIETIIEIKKLFPKQLIEIKLTITKNNYKSILYISKLADRLWVFFSFKPVENMSRYTNQDKSIDTTFNENEIKIIEKYISNNIYIKKQDFYINKEFFYSIPNYLKTWLWESKKMCNIANNSITIMPDWKIYSCILMKSIWKITNNSIDEIWKWDKIIKQKKDIVEWKCSWCMLMCWSFKSKNIYEK